MKVSLSKSRISFFGVFLALISATVSCGEKEEPIVPPIVENPITVDPDDDIDGLFAQIQGKWIFGERNRNSDRQKPNISRSLFGISPPVENSNTRVMDDFQGFIEFLSDTTYIFNDPKVLRQKWNLEYGKFQIDVANKRLVLAGFGEIEIKELKAESLKFELKVTTPSASHSLEGVKRGFLDSSEKTKLISRVWQLSDENEFGKGLLDDLKSGGVDIYNEHGQVIETIFPDGALFFFTPSGTLMTAHLIGTSISPFDLSNWRWSSISNRIISNYDYTQLEDNESYQSEIKVLNENRLVVADSWIDDEGVRQETELIFNAFER